VVVHLFPENGDLDVYGNIVRVSLENSRLSTWVRNCMKRVVGVLQFSNAVYQFFFSVDKLINVCRLIKTSGKYGFRHRW